MKKFFTSKAFVASALVCLCLVIVGVCWFVSQKKPAEFIPEVTTKPSQQTDWVEPSTPADSSIPNIEVPKETESYPKVVVEDEENTVIDFTPPQSATPEPAPPKAPEGKTEVKDPNTSHATNKDPQVTPPKENPPKQTGPTPGSTNDKGEFYDPVFGWVKPGEAVTKEVDNDGDPNKMVGSMGD